MTTTLHPRSISWPVKNSFRTYVEHLRDGAVGARDGAVIEPESFAFPIVQTRSIRPTESFGDVLGAGEIRFVGYGGLLVVPIRRPVLVREGDLRYALTIEYPWAADTPQPRVRIADVDMEPAATIRDDAWVRRSVSVALTEAGAELFNGSYKAGEQLDPLTVICDVD